MKKRIIVVDDDEKILKFLRRVLVKCDYSVASALNGYEALDYLKDYDVDLIILDRNMPGMDGIQFLKVIREKKITEVPVLMMSGSGDTTQRTLCYELGVYDYIMKPEQTEIMLKRIENGLKIGDLIKFSKFMNVELNMAKKLQRYLYPDPHLITENVDLRTWVQPLSDVGGDLFDYIHFRDGRVIFLLADVSGHSISAALYTAIVKMVFRNAVKNSDDPSVILTEMNQELYKNIPIEMFVTIFCGLYDGNTKTLNYSNGGHPSPFCINDKDVFELQGNDPFLGAIAEYKYQLFQKDVRWFN